jgi:hypothetical protein
MTDVNYCEGHYPGDKTIVCQLHALHTGPHRGTMWSTDNEGNEWSNSVSWGYKRTTDNIEVTHD